MHHASHILMRCIALWCVISSGKAARTTVNPEILANFAKNVASVLSPVILGELQSRSNRSFQSFQTEPATLHDDDLDSHSNAKSLSKRFEDLNNIVDKTPNEATYYEPNSYSYNDLYERSPEELEISGGNRQLQDSFSRDESYLRHEQPNFYKSYDFSTSKDNLEVAPKSTNNENIEASIRNIEGSSTSLYPLYHGADFHKAAFPYGPFLAKPYGGFHGFGPYGHFHHHHHHHPYGDDGSGESSSEENARLENGTNHHYGPPFGNYGYGHPFPYGGYGHDPFYGPYGRNGNDSGNGRNGHYGYGNGHGPYHGGPYPGFYGHPYGPSYGHNGNNNNNNNNGETSSRQTEEPAENGNQNNSTKNGYSHFYGPPFLKPVVGPFHGPFPFSFPHYNGVFKGGPVGAGHIGYPFYADPFLIGFPFHHPYGPFFHGKKYLPPKGKPADSGESGESTETPAGELMEESPDRITATNEEVVAPASSSNRYKTSGRKGSKRTSSIVNFERKV